MSQNVWAIIMPFGAVTLIFYWPKKKFSGQPKAALISGTAGPHKLFKSFLKSLLSRRENNQRR